jgi:hypothetical protein
VCVDREGNGNCCEEGEKFKGRHLDNKTDKITCQTHREKETQDYILQMQNNSNRNFALKDHRKEGCNNDSLMNIDFLSSFKNL